MKLGKFILFAVLLTLFATRSEGKSVQVKNVYMFGFSASFKDSVVYITDIQDVQGAWMDKKNKFLSGRDNYSYQLRDHFVTQLQQPNRVCMVFFDTSKKKCEKKYRKLLKKYTGNKKHPAHYDIRHLTEQEFKFQVVDMSTE